MRAYELMKETFFRRTYIWILHVIWLALYGGYYWLFVPETPEMGRFIFIWAGFFLALALSAGIFGDDIDSGRICVLVTKPFWIGELYLYRLLGLSFQAAVHLLLAGGLILVVHAVTRKGQVENLGVWLLASWLLFNTCAALSTSLSVVIGRAFNSLFLLVVIITCYFTTNLLMPYVRQEAASLVLTSFIRYPWPPFELLYKLANGDWGQYALTVGKYSVTKSVACVIHTLMLTLAYSAIGIILLRMRQFSRVRD
jgi:ABC-type transport system involved in multi-copper enzyme maturation permease subunit